MYLWNVCVFVCVIVRECVCVYVCMYCLLLKGHAPLHWLILHAIVEINTLIVLSIGFEL